MAGSQRVQDYLQRHKIGLLFEDLMSKLVTAMPDEPLVFLTRVIERKQLRQSRGISPTRKSATFSAGTRKLSPDPLRRSMPASTDSMGVPKSLPTSGVQSNLKRGAKPKGMKSTVNFEESWKDTKRNPSPTRLRHSSSGTTAAFWGDDEDEDLLYRSGSNNRRRRIMAADDDLSAEFSLSKPTAITSDKRLSQGLGLPRSSRYGRHVASANHKKELQALIASTKRDHTASDSGIDSEERDLEPDYAVEVMENMDDLRAEGVKNIKQTGNVRLQKSRRSRADSDPQVRVSICARCAKIMTGEASVPAEGTCYGELPEYDCDSEREFPRSLAQTARTDEEFESVSQVTGPRKPVWHSEGESSPEELHKFNAVPSTSKSLQSNSTGFTGHSAFRKTWNAETFTDTENDQQSNRSKKTFTVDDDDDTATASKQKDEDTMLEGQGWQTMEGNYDSDSTAQTDTTRGGHRGYSGAY